MEESRGVLSLEQEFYLLAKGIVETDIYLSQKKNRHHQYTNVYDHCLGVAYESFLYAKRHNGYNLSVVVRGALLHDFYLYDRFAPREQTKRKGLHGYTHSKVARNNAEKYFQLSEIEKNIIETHMWPLTLFHMPKYKEAWLVSRMDKKICRREAKLRAPAYVFKISREK